MKKKSAFLQRKRVLKMKFNFSKNDKTKSKNLENNKTKYIFLF